MTHALTLAYQQALAQHLYPDSAQALAVEHLQAALSALNQGLRPRGVYLWGPVGRGKTFLMDLFFKHLTVPAKRQHFHLFMRFVHQRLFQLTGTANPLQALAKELAQEVRVLCFDELFISDIGDAMLLGGLLQALLDEGLVLVATSNQRLDQLYHDGYNRARLLPAIDALKAHLDELCVDGGTDHRLHQGAPCQRYWVNDLASFEAAFNALSISAATRTPLTIGPRHVPVIKACAEAAWFDFATLCEGPYTALEFIELAQRFKAIFVSGVPCLSGAPQACPIARGTEDAAQKVAAGDRILPSLAPHDNAVRRFIALIDECYEQRVPVLINADVALDALYTQGYLQQAFARTHSRLKEMQWARYP